MSGYAGREQVGARGAASLAQTGGHLRVTWGTCGGTREKMGVGGSSVPWGMAIDHRGLETESRFCHHLVSK